MPRSGLVPAQQRQLEVCSGSSRFHDAGSSLRSSGWPCLPTFGDQKRSLGELSLKDGLEPSLPNCSLAANVWNREAHKIRKEIKAFCGH